MRRLGFVVVLLLVMLAGAARADAAIITVTSVDDAGAGTLRQAITDANVAATADVIEFDVGAVGGFIALESPLPSITQPVTIDGTSDPEYFGDPVVFLDGTSAGLLANGLTVTAGPTTIKGLDIEFFEQHGISITGGSATLSANVLGSNLAAGVRLGTSGNTLVGNTIGGFGGGNEGAGVLLGTGAAANTIGGTVDGEGNQIQGNAAGVVLEAAAGNGNRILGNAIGGNDGGTDGLGIDLNADGITANDNPDVATGANTSLNFPVLSNVTSDDASTTVAGALDARAGTLYRIEFFGVPQCDQSGNGEGDSFLGTANVTTNGSGHAAINTVLPDPLTDRFVTATATDPAGNTSEFSPCQAGPPSGVVVSNGTVQLGINKTGIAQLQLRDRGAGLPGPQRGGHRAGRAALRPAQHRLDGAGLPVRGLGRRRRRQRTDRLRQRVRGNRQRDAGLADALRRRQDRDGRRRRRRPVDRRPLAAGDASLPAVRAEQRALRGRRQRPEHRHACDRRPAVPPRHGLGHRADRVQRVGHQPRHVAAAALRLRPGLRHRPIRWAARSTSTPRASAASTTRATASSRTSARAASTRPSRRPTTTAACSTSASARCRRAPRRSSPPTTARRRARPPPIAALNAGGAQVYSLGQSDCPNGSATGGCDAMATGAGPTQGTPATFMFGFVTTSGDLSITQSDSPDPAAPGQQVTYTLTVHNNGPDAAAAVQVEDTLPSGTGVTIGAITTSKGTCAAPSGGKVLCSLGSMPSGSTETITVHATRATAGTLTNAAVVSSPSEDANPGNNDSTESTTVASTATLSVNDVTVTEGNAGSTTATFTITRAGDTSGSSSVHYATSAGTATAGTDYTSLSDTTVTFDPAQTSKTVNVSVIGDTVDEFDETYTLELSGATGATISDGSGLGTITDDDAAPSLSVNDVTVTEGDSGTTNATFSVTLSQASGKTVTVSAASADGSATVPGNDYTATGSVPLSFAPGQTTQTVTVAVKGDTLDEVDETYVVNLSGASNATIADSQGTGTITDDDAAPSLSVDDVSVTEGNSPNTTNAIFTVTLSQASGKTVGVSAASADGSATVIGNDYTATGSVPLSFSPGQTTKTVTVIVKGDASDEVDETYAVNLSGASNATIADSQGIGTIVDDDGPSIAISDVTVDPEGTGGTSNASFTVSLSGPSPQAVSVEADTVAGTATAPADFAATSQTLNWAAGDATARTVTVPITPMRSTRPTRRSPSRSATRSGRRSPTRAGRGRSSTTTSPRPRRSSRSCPS